MDAAQLQRDTVRLFDLMFRRNGTFPLTMDAALLSLSKSIVRGGKMCLGNVGGALDGFCRTGSNARKALPCG